MKLILLTIFSVFVFSGAFAQTPNDSIGFYISSLQYDKAEATISEAMKQDNKNPQLFYWKGYIALQKKQYQQALGYLAAAVKLKADFHEALSASAQAYLATENIEEAIKLYDKAILYCANCKEYYFERGKANYAIGNRTSSLSDFEKVISLDSVNAAAFNSRGLARIDILNIEKSGYADLFNAYLDFSKSIQLSPDYQLALRNRGMVLYNLGRYNDAYRDLKRATQLNVNDAKSFELLGLVMFELNQYSSSIEAFTKAIEVSKNSDANVYLGRAKSYMKMNDLVNARLDLEDVLIVDARLKPLVYWLLARTYALEKEKSKMMGYLNKAQKAGYFDNRDKVNELRNLNEFSIYQTDKDYFDFLRKVADMN